MMKLDRTINYNFGWVLFIGLVDLVFLFLRNSCQSDKRCAGTWHHFGSARCDSATMSSGASSETLIEPLLFSWDSPRQQKAVFAIFVVMSLVGHAFCFYVFQIAYPTPVALLPPPAGVTFIVPDSEQGRTLLRWIDAEDPALAFTTHAPPQTKIDAVSKAEHLPSYFALDPPLKKILAFTPDLRIPSSRPPGAVPTLPRKTVSAGATGRTYISFSKELKQFGIASIPQARFAASHEETPETLRFRIAVSDLGEIRYCFPVNSSGDPALDEQARLQIIRTRFLQNRQTGTKPGSSLVWGMATIQWG